MKSLEKKPANGGNPIKENKEIVNKIELIGWRKEKPFNSTKFSIEKKFLEFKKLDKTEKKSTLFATYTIINIITEAQEVSTEKLPIPKRINPSWFKELYAKKRFKLLWLNAPRLPIIKQPKELNKIKWNQKKKKFLNTKNKIRINTKIKLVFKTIIK